MTQPATRYYYHYCACLRYVRHGREMHLYVDGVQSLQRPAVGEGMAMLRRQIAAAAFDGDEGFVLMSLSLLHREGPAVSLTAADLETFVRQQVISLVPSGVPAGVELGSAQLAGRVRGDVE